jgi:lipoprotein-anchoring transpeptidase ErfK/SrfK
MVVKQDGQVIREIPVSLGRDKYPTYNGIHVVAEKYENKLMDSSTWGLTGAGAYRTNVQWATRISSSGEFVHAAPWSVDSQGYENVSHGCVNVSTEAAKWFYDTFIPGDPVIIRNTVGPNLEVWAVSPCTASPARSCTSARPACGAPSSTGSARRPRWSGRAAG